MTVFRLLSVAVLGALLACSHGDTSAPPEEPTGGESTGSEASASEAQSEEENCVAQCVQDRQAQATSIEKIEADCAAECTAAE